MFSVSEELWLASGSPVKFRVIVFAQSRWDLLAKVQEKVAALWPDWRVLVVQLAKSKLQTLRLVPSYVIVCGPPQDMKATEVPTTHLLTPKARRCTVLEGVQLRCTERDCPLRPLGSLPEGKDPTFEISDDHRAVDILAMLHAEAAEIAAQDPEAPEEGNEDEGMEEDVRKRDCLVDLWPFAQSIAFYEEVFQVLGKLDSVSVGVLASGTAHPASALAFRRARVVSFVITHRLHQHALAHGLEIARKVRMVDLRPSGGTASGAPRSNRYEIMAGPNVPASAQVVESWDVAQGGLWWEGLNKILSGEQIAKNAQKLLEAELSANPVQLKAPEGDMGRGLTATRSIREGETITLASSLFFDDEAELMKFLSMGNDRFRDRIVGIGGLQHDGVPRASPVHAVLVGVAQFVQHYVTIRRSPNARWVFDPAAGFNSAALKLVVQTRNAAGIAAGSDIVVNYGATFDFTMGKRQDGENKFSGLLDDIFKGQQQRIDDLRVECDGGDGEAEKKKKREDLESEQKKKAEVDKQKADQKNKADAEQKTKAEAERKRAEAAEKIQVDTELKRKRGEVAGSSEEPQPKVPKANTADSSAGGAAGSPSGESPPFQHEHGTLQLSGSSWVIKATGSENKKIPKHSLLGWAGAGNVVKAAKCADKKKTLVYSVSNKTLIFDRAGKKVVQFDKYIESLSPKVKQIWGCSKLAVPGAVPKGDLTIPGSDAVFACEDIGARRRTFVVTSKPPHSPLRGSCCFHSLLSTWVFTHSWRSSGGELAGLDVDRRWASHAPGHRQGGSDPPVGRAERCAGALGDEVRPVGLQSRAFELGRGHGRSDHRAGQGGGGHDVRARVRRFGSSLCRPNGPLLLSVHWPGDRTYRARLPPC
jgi:hypothetical protein